MEKETLRLIFGLKIHLLRSEKGLTLAQLAEKTNTVVSYLHDIEKGKKYPSSDKIIALAAALDTSYDALVALGGMKRIQPIVDLVTSDFLKNYPLGMFGLQPEKIIELISSDPSKLGALISAIVKIGRSYDLDRESLYVVALRSYQDMHDNYFPELETAAANLRAAAPETFSSERVADAAPLEQLLKERFGIQTDRQALAARPELRHIKSYFSEKKGVFYLNTGFSAAQERFLMGREIAFQSLGKEPRPFETIVQQTENFETLLHNFEASYFASALLMPPDEMAGDIRRCAGALNWEPEAWQALLERYNVTPEMLLQRFTNVLPGRLGLKDLFFIRMTGDEALDRFFMTKELHLNGRQSPYATERDQHYCRRWISLEILHQLRVGGLRRTLTMAQISEYHQTDNRYVVISMAKQAGRDRKSGVSVSLGLRLNDDVQRIFKFTGDPALTRKTVGSTCETCAMADCNSRAAPPVVIERQEERREVKAALEALDQ